MADIAADRRALQVLHQQDLADVERLFPGPAYRDVLGWIHDYRRPRNYLEIGVNLGLSFALTRPETRAVGVDPAPNLSLPVTGRIFEETSDAFFARPDLRDIVDAPVELAFVDGLHSFDQTLRDFINVERIAAPDSLIVLHDVHPFRPEVATRDRRRIFWTGDVWKTAAILRQERPDLSLTYVPASPSGMLLVTGLDPASKHLDGRFDTLVDSWMPRSLPDNTAEVVAGFASITNTEAAVCDYLSRVVDRPASAEALRPEPRGPH
ncbi:class I SAM-dependent methyltransferase [Thalassobaculum sp.]|uniref:class I SAM-dependent methyltransferase n=1 Tax=Thalassobaculum sp. TaxID=2022740 RepID=UPI0032EB5DB7